jgi:hypothetical protein
MQNRHTNPEGNTKDIINNILRETGILDLSFLNASQISQFAYALANCNDAKINFDKLIAYWQSV